MTTQVINWCTPDRLNCGTTLPATVYICVPAYIVDPPVTSTNGVVVGTATQVRESTCADPCGPCKWVYTIEYDDDQLVDGYLLVPAYINSVQCDCIADYLLSITGNFWNLYGNAGTVDGTNFLGTIDDVPLSFRVNNLRVGRIFTSDVVDGPNIVFGSSTNTISDTGNSYSSTISGGIDITITEAHDSVVGGGDGLSINGTPVVTLGSGWHTIGGGYNSFIDFTQDAPLPEGLDNYCFNTISGGYWSSITNGTFCTIGGGDDGIIVNGNGATISGGARSPSSGYINYIASPGDTDIALGSTIGGGSGNSIDPEGPTDSSRENGGSSTISGGQENLISWRGENPTSVLGGAGRGFHTIGGGQINEIIAGGLAATIAGGTGGGIVYDPDTLNPTYAYGILGDFIGGGVGNSIGSAIDTALDIDRLGFNVVGGGGLCSILNGMKCFVGGGRNNQVDIQGSNGVPYTPTSWGPVAFDTVVGGADNTILLGQASSILGGIANAVVGDACATIGGGFHNLIKAVAPVAPQVLSNDVRPINPPTTARSGNTIVGGGGNYILDGFYTTILGGAFLQLGAASAGYQSPSTRSFAGVVAGAAVSFNSNNPASLSQVDLSAFSDIFYMGDVDLWIGNTGNSAKKVKFFEPNTDTDFSSANFSSFRAQAQGANIEYIWPAAAGVAGNSLKIQSVVGTTVTLEWA